MSNVAIDYIIHPYFNLFAGRATGKITFADLLQHVEIILADSAYEAGMHGLYDFTQLESITGDPNDWGRAAEEVSDAERVPKTSQTAIVIDMSNEVVERFMRGYLLMTSQSLVDFKVFGANQWQLALEHVGVDSLGDPSLLFDSLQDKK